MKLLQVCTRFASPATCACAVQSPVPLIHHTFFFFFASLWCSCSISRLVCAAVFQFLFVYPRSPLFSSSLPHCSIARSLSCASPPPAPTRIYSPPVSSEHRPHAQAIAAHIHTHYHTRFESACRPSLISRSPSRRRRRRGLCECRETRGGMCCEQCVHCDS